MAETETKPKEGIERKEEPDLERPRQPAKRTKAKRKSAPEVSRQPAIPHSSLAPEHVAQTRRGLFSRLSPILLTLTAVACAVPLSLAMWDVYMGAPWTRDGTVRAYVITLAPEVAGRIDELHVVDNEYVHKNDLLMVIDPTNYRIAVKLAEATVSQAEANAQNAAVQAERRRKLTTLSTSLEEQQTFAANALATKAQTEQAQASLEQAQTNLERTQIRSPVNGYVTNLSVQLGDYVEIGKTSLSIVDADSFWVDGYFEETNLASIQVGDPVRMKLMGYTQILRGHVDSIARAIDVSNANPNGQGVATVNPIFTWVRLAQRIPVRVHIDDAPRGVVLSAGMTATVQIEPRN
jgi:RND family efflux transporter MFP subunit